MLPSLLILAAWAAFLYGVMLAGHLVDRYYAAQQSEALALDRHLHPSTSGALPGERTWRDGAR